MTARHILDELHSVADEAKATHLQRFFKTGAGQYGEGDTFLGIVVPVTRRIAMSNHRTPLNELDLLIKSKYHEARLCALLILTERCRKTSGSERDELYRFYLAHTDHINNWDLVDLSCPTVVGAHLVDREREVLYRMAEKQHLWEQRIAIVSTHAFIRQNDFGDTFALSKKLITHPHDLIHKAVGWMLRETGKRDRESLTAFLEIYATRLPRTALRYAIEHYPEAERQYFLKKK
ncbi:MAG: DNA alkylation repair protein [Tannerella sp.]|jgi:3-methyladenine DNA glycosylase AlkD|nr:DNA alkylation repair protein [Tannerella sp.]